MFRIRGLTKVYPTGEVTVQALRGGRAVIVPVTLGARSGLAAQGTSGIESGEQVIIYPGERVGDGLRSQPRT